MSGFAVRAVRALSTLLRRAAIGRVPRLFDEAYYRATHPCVARCGLDPFLHYVWRGAALDHRPNADFDAAFYRRQSGPTRLDPLRHYLTVGAGNGLDPSPAFSTLMYLMRYPDVAQAGINPLLHYRQDGRSEGRIAAAWASAPEEWIALARVGAEHRWTYPAHVSPRFSLSLLRDVAGAAGPDAVSRLCLILTLDRTEIDGMVQAFETFPESGLDALTLEIDTAVRPHPPAPTVVIALERCSYGPGPDGAMLLRYAEARIWNVFCERPRMALAGPAGCLAVRVG